MTNREAIDALLARLDRIARDHNGYDYGLPIELEPQRAQLRETVREWLAEWANVRGEPKPTAAST